MISLVIGSAIAMAGLQASISAPRAAFVACLKQASSQAMSDKLATDAFEGALRAACAGQATSLKGALVGFDVKNGVARKRAASDADLQIDDYLASSLDNYTARMPAAKAPPSASVAAATPPSTAVPAAAQK